MRKQMAALVARGLARSFRYRRAAVAALAMAGTALVFGAPADLARGIAWLQAQVQTSGGLLADSRVAATSQAQCETATTLLRLAGNSSQVASLVAALQSNGAVDATESLACWQRLRQQLGQSVLGADVELRRVNQRGYAAYEGFVVSSTLDSGWALAAQLQKLSDTDKSNLLAWLQARQATEGSFATAGRADLAATAVVLRGLQDEAARSPVAGAIATKAAGWLLGRRNAQGNWLSDVGTTALAFEAVHPYTGNDATVASAVEGYLLAQQQADGSWDGDAYVTAVALRALALTSVQPVDPTLAASATVRGAATLASTGQPLAGVTVKAQPISGVAKDALTDALGNYLVQGVTPGGISLSASLAGYQTITAQVSVDAGATAVFSPAMYPAGSSAPTGARIKGQVQAFGSGVSLPGVTVQTAGATQITAQTDAQGAFDIAVSAGNHTVTYSLAGYNSQVQQIALSGGSTADVGVIVLKPTRATSSLRGSVLDLQGRAVAGATVAVQGGPSAESNSAGAYSIGEVSGLQFNIQVSATGYATRNFNLAVSQPGDVVQDFNLPGVTTAYLSMVDFTLSAQSAGLREDVTATAIVSNTSPAEASAVATAVVVDPAGQRVASLVATDATGEVLPPMVLQPGQQQKIHFKWNTGAFAPGSYRLTSRLQVPDTSSRENPDGLIIASLHQWLSVVPQASFFGSVTANPPVLQTGTNTPVKLSALIQNDGNVMLPAQDYRLAIVDTVTGQATYTQTISAPAQSVSQLQPLAFADWTPEGAGNFRVEVSAPSTPGNLVTTTLFIGAAGQASLAVDKSLVPAGNQTVRATVTVTGQNLLNGTIQDPLAPLIKQAVTTAVTYGDNAAYNENFNKNCFACHIQTQAIAGGERSLKFTPPVNALRRAVVMSSITARAVNPNAAGSYGSYEAGAIGPQATIVGQPPSADSRLVIGALALWATSQWHDPAAVNFTKARFARYMMGRQNTDGTWTPDDISSWWGAKSPLAAVTLGSLVNVRSELQVRPQSFTGKTMRPLSLSGGSWPAGSLRSTVAADGTIYFAVLGQGVWSRSPSGVLTRLLPDATHAWAVQALQDGRLAVGTDSGVWIWDSSGGFNKLANLLVYTIKQFPNGDLLVLGPWWDTSGKVYRVSLTGTVQLFINNGYVMSGTVDATFMPDGSLLTLNTANGIVWRFSPQGALIDSPIPRAPQGSAMYSLLPYQGGLILSGGNGFFIYNKDWVVQRMLGEYAFGVVQMPDGRVVANYAGGGLQEMIDSPADLTGLTSQIDTTFNKAVIALKNDSSVANPANNVEVAFRLMALGYAKTYYQGTARYTEFDSLMQSIAQTLRSRQRPDGGWVWREGAFTASDSMVTAIVGVALDTQNPSPNSPEVRNAIQFLLSPGARNADGTWLSQNGLAVTAVNASTWVEIWLPTMLDRLATLDSTLSLTFAPNVAMSNPDLAPSSSTTGPDGSTTYLWNLSTSDTGKQINFDLALANMQVDEVRPVAQDASLLFKNSVTGGTVTSAITVPTVAVNTNLTETVATNKPSYIEADQAVFTATVSNGGTVQRTGQVRFSVLDSTGQLVQTLPLPAAVNVAGGASSTSVATWPAGGMLAGSYQLKSELLSPTGLLYGAATASFTVTASQVQPASARVNTDRASYSAAQTVQVTSRIANSTANTALENLQARTDVRSAGGASVFSRTEPIDQLASGGSRQYGYSIGAGSLAPGSYAADVQLLASSGSVLSQSTTSFTVLGADQTGIGITAQLQAAPDVLFVGQTTHLTLQVTNNSTVSLSSVPLTVRIVDPVTASVVASFTATVADWAAGENRNFGFDWSAVGEHGQVMVAAASAVVAGKNIPLAQAKLKILGILFTGTVAADPREVEVGDKTVLNYSVTNPTGVAGRMTGNLAVQTQAGQTLGTWPLDLGIAGLGDFAGNQLYTTGEQLQTLTAVLSQQLGTTTSVLATTSFTIIDRPVPLGVNTGLKGQARILVLVSCPPGLGVADDAACVAQRSQAIVTYFSGLGLAARAVATNEAFLAAMRCGSYNTYWVSGGAIKLDEQTVGELREAVYRGEALWMDGVHDSRNQLLHPAAGVKEIGKLPASNQVESSIEQGLYGAGDLPTMGQPTKFEVTTGQAQGLFTQVPGQQAPVPAIVSNDYGRGKSLLFAFDLAAMVTADALQANSQLAGFVTTSASYGASGSPTLTLGDITQLSASINNRGTRTVSFKAEATLPAALASIATAPQALLLTNADGSTLATWNFSLAGGATQELGWLARAMDTGSFSAPLSIYSMPSAGSSLPPKLRVTTTFAVEVKDAASLLQQPLAAASALEPTASSDKTNKAKAVNAISQALTLYAQGSYEPAISQWLAAADALAGITSVDTTAARSAVSLAIEAATDALCIQRCGTAACQ